MTFGCTVCLLALLVVCGVVVASEVGRGEVESFHFFVWVNVCQKVGKSSVVVMVDVDGMRAIWHYIGVTVGMGMVIMGWGVSVVVVFFPLTGVIAVAAVVVVVVVEVFLFGVVGEPKKYVALPLDRKVSTLPVLRLLRKALITSADGLSFIRSISCTFSIVEALGHAVAVVSGARVD